ncbi:MAG: hypothetical protein CK425_09340 [Parachlamydia sp.]|nr:MAG: hypothetical protein CK425_09340 [Parachlamydia sp.]
MGFPVDLPPPIDLPPPPPVPTANKASGTLGIQVAAPLPNAESEAVKQKFEKTAEATHEMKGNLFKKGTPVRSVKKEKIIIGAKELAESAKKTKAKKRFQGKGTGPAAKEQNQQRWQFLRKVLNFLLFWRSKKPTESHRVSKEQIKDLKAPKKDETSFPEANFVENKLYTQAVLPKTEKVPPPSELPKPSKEEIKIAKLKKKEEEKITKQIAPYHNIIKQLQAKVDKKFSTPVDVQGEQGILRESGSVKTVKHLKAHFKDQKLIEKANLLDLVGVAKSLVFTEMPLDRFQALHMDELFFDMQRHNKSSSEVVNALKEKIDTLTPAEKEFLKDLVRLTDTIYTQSWKPRPGMEFKNMVLAAPTLARIFDHQNTGLATTMADATNNPLIPIGVALFPFFIEHQQTLFA